MASGNRKGSEVGKKEPPGRQLGVWIQGTREAVPETVSLRVIIRTILKIG